MVFKCNVHFCYVFNKNKLISTEPLVITGDFNVLVDDSTNPDATRLLDLLDSMGLCQHVTQPTHELGYTNDLIITRQSDSIICSSPVTVHLFSDLLSVLTTLRATKPKIILKERVYRNIKSNDLDSFCSDLVASEVCQDTPIELSSQQDSIIGMQNCIKDICLWMEHDKLLLNDEKTEFLIVGTRQQLSKVSIPSITVGNSVVMRSSVVKNLGVFIDDKPSMNSHINKICNTSFYYHHDII